MKAFVKKRYWKYESTGNIFPKPAYWEPLQAGWIEVTKEEYEDFAIRRGLL